MRKSIFIKASICVIILGSVFSPANSQESMRSQLSEDVFIEKIDERVWRHVSRKALEGFGLVASNGLIVLSGEEALLVDTAFTDGQTALILDWIEKELKAKAVTAVITHHHDDRLGGIGEVHKRGIRTIGSAITARLAKEQSLEPPARTFEKNITLTVGGRSVRVWYPGPGHSIDNIVVWVPDRKILFGGCLIKAAESAGLGNTKDADMKQWPETVETVYREFKDVRMVVPGHGDVAGVNALERTLELLKMADK